MKIFCFLVFASLPLIAVAGGDAAMLQRPELVRFSDDAQRGEHLAGEWDPDLSKKEKRLIERTINKYCGLAQMERSQLLKKYQADAAVLQVLNQDESVSNSAAGK